VSNKQAFQLPLIRNRGQQHASSILIPRCNFTKWRRSESCTLGFVDGRGLTKETRIPHRHTHRRAFLF
jgi:hypothetical protein